MQHLAANTSALAQEAALDSLKETRDNTWATLRKEIKHRVAIHEATGDESLALEGVEHLTGQLGEAAASADPQSAVKGVLIGELALRLHGASVCLPDELGRLLVAKSGCPAWTEKREDGGLFFIAKAWAVAEALGVDLARFAMEPFLEHAGGTLNV